jgi:predicted ATPase
MEVKASLLEREREIAALERLLDRARDSRGAVVLIEGPAGIGKSRLLAATRERASGMTVLTARCSELEREFSFGAVRQLFEPLMRDGEIAQSLFVKPKTVEVHLSSAYRKLDIRSRRELAGALSGV